jgi:hypothetical protein
VKQSQVALKYGWRSGLEEKIGAQLTAAGVRFRYEELTGEYRVPVKVARYTPDFILPNGIVVESKGRWLTADRQKIGLITEQFPALDLRMVFSNSRSRISKQSKTTYATICDRLEIPYADKLIPQEWLDEPDSEIRWAAIEEFRWAGAKSRRKSRA